MADADLARSPLVLSFLELSEAARVIPHASPAGGPPDRLPTSEDSRKETLAEPSPEESHIIAQQNFVTASTQERQMRLGFRIEQRTILKKHIRQLRRHLDEIENALRAAAAAG